MASTSKEKNRKPEQQQRAMVKRLHLVGGSFFSADDARPNMAMDAEAWNRLPEELMWEVLLRLPAAKHFQLQSVSRKWRQMLTSAHFRSRLMAAAAAAAAPRDWEQQQVVACACVPEGGAREGGERDSSRSSGRPPRSKKLKVVTDSSSSRRKVKVVDIDLSGFVPNWFWKLDSYSVVAAGGGLLCISNDSELKHLEEEWEAWKPWTNQYCVVNPVTRTCIVLPRPPFRPRGWLIPSTDALAIYTEWEVATYDLATSGGRWVSAAHSVRPPTLRRPASPEPLSMVLCGGETHRFRYGRVHVLVPGPGGRLVNAAAPVDAWSFELLDLDTELQGSVSSCIENEFLVAHRGAVFFLADLAPDCADPSGPEWFGVPFATWRLAREQMEWEFVTQLQYADLERLTGLRNLGKFDTLLLGAYGTGKLMCCQFDVFAEVANIRTSATFLLAFDLEAGEWELLHHDHTAHWKPDVPSSYEPDSFQVATPMELRPHLFLSQTGTPTCSRSGSSANP